MNALRRVWCLVFHRQYRCRIFETADGWAREYVHPGKEPTEGVVVDAKEIHEVRDQGNVVPLQNSADDLNKKEIPNEPCGNRAGFAP